MDMEPKNLLKAWRLAQRSEDGRPLSQASAAEMVGATGPAWHEWETGGRTPRAHRAALETLTGIPALVWADAKEREHVETATRSRAELDASAESDAPGEAA